MSSITDSSSSSCSSSPGHSRLKSDTSYLYGILLDLCPCTALEKLQTGCVLTFSEAIACDRFQNRETMHERGCDRDHLATNTGMLQQLTQHVISQAQTPLDSVLKVLSFTHKQRNMTELQHRGENLHQRSQHAFGARFLLLLSSHSCGTARWRALRA